MPSSAIFPTAAEKKWDFFFEEKFVALKIHTI